MRKSIVNNEKILIHVSFSLFKSDFVLIVCYGPKFSMKKIHKNLELKNGASQCNKLIS